MVMLAIMLIGGMALFHLQLDMLPAINPPILAVITELPGASAKEVLMLVTERVEAVAATTSGIKKLRSSTREGTSFVILEFYWETKMSEARTELAEKLDLLPLPEDAQKPRVVKFDPSMLPLMQIYIASADQMPLDRVTTLVERKVRPRLEAVPGVAAVNLSGGITREVRIELDREKLYRQNIGLSRVAGLIATSALNMPAGSASVDSRTRNVRLLSQPGSLDELSSLTVGFDRALQAVNVGQLGSVEEKAVPGSSVTRLDSSPAIGLYIQKEGSSNTVSVARAVRRELSEIRRDLPDLKSEVMIDQGMFIEDSLSSTARSLLVGGFFALVVLLGFLGSILSTLIVAISIPFSVLTTFALLFLSGMTLNIMTLGGLALGVGMLVDNSIVVIENIYRHMELGEERTIAAREGSNEVAGAITASTLTTIVVFLPVVFVGGLTGILFRELALTVTYALLASLAVSLTVIPLLSSRWLKQQRRPGGNTNRPRLSEKVLKGSLKNKIPVLAASLLMLALAATGIRLVGTEFLPSVDEGVFTVELLLPAGTGLKETSERAERMEEMLKRMPHVDRVTVQVGSATGMGQSGGTSNTAQLIVTLAENNRSTLDVMKEARLALDKGKKQDEEIVLNLYSSLFFAPGNSANLLQLNASGPDPDRLKELARLVVKKLEGTEGLTNVQSSAEVALPEFHVLVNEEDALRYGLTPRAVGQDVSRALQGQLAGRLNRGEEMINIRVMLKEEESITVEELEKIPVESPAAGMLVPLGRIASVEDGAGPATITREDQREGVEITGQIEGRDMGSMLSAALRRIEGVVPEGYKVTSAGSALLMQEGFASLRKAFILSLILIYMVLAAQFESLRAPFVIILTAPLAGVGVIAALLLTGTPFSITAFIGLIILGGVVVNNGIVLVDVMEKRQSAGAGAEEAALEAVRLRVRPVLMTAFTTILGLLPLAAKLGEGTELQAPLARVMIGGLLSATLLTLVVIPVFYTIVARRKVA